MRQLASTVDEGDDQTDSYCSSDYVTKNPTITQSQRCTKCRSEYDRSCAINLYNQPGKTLPDAHLDYAECEFYYWGGGGGGG